MKAYIANKVVDLGHVSRDRIATDGAEPQRLSICGTKASIKLIMDSLAEWHDLLIECHAQLKVEQDSA